MRASSPSFAPRLRSRVASRWSRLTSTQRRRIVLGAMVALALAARDLVLLAAAGGMLALSESVPARRALPQPG